MDRWVERDTGVTRKVLGGRSDTTRSLNTSNECR